MRRTGLIRFVLILELSSLCCANSSADSGSFGHIRRHTKFYVANEFNHIFTVIGRNLAESMYKCK